MNEPFEFALVRVDCKWGFAFQSISKYESFNKLTKTALSYQVWVALRISNGTVLSLIERSSDLLRIGGI
jgi:hypothetical protein